MAVMKRLLVVRFESCLALFKDNLKTLSQVLNSLTSLECLYIGNLPQIQSLLEQRLLSSLSELSICHCPNLQSLPESAFPSSLSKLTIEDCRNLQSLPGEYWPEIAHIPEIYISVAILRRMPVMINKKEAPTDRVASIATVKLKKHLEISMKNDKKGVAQSVCGIIWKGMNSRKKLTLRITFSS
ncbi:hypothetical protein T459_34772 [Capsicum annuum]|uniref:Uncharacterized protein n=1 Tax=Capsicum annuum TaxID=4072 RepID=A0A2G2XV58_CAPAN|nr:hypothetical protein T459_34772 [Capsicum annuum]